MPKNNFGATVATETTHASTALPSSRRLLWLLGPALVAGVAYLDPGNVAANMSAGAQYGYLLVWVVVSGNVMAWLVQYLSAKLGVVTGKSLPEALRDRFGTRAGRIAYWLQAEAVAMATDIAEVIGGAVALYLLFDLPLLLGGLITGVISMGLLLVQTHKGPWVFERIVIALLLIIAVGFCAGVVIAPPEASSMARRAGSALRRRQLGAAGRIDPRGNDHAPRHLRAFLAGPRPLRPGPEPAQHPPPAEGNALGRLGRHAHRGLGQRRHVAAGRRQPCGGRGNRFARGRARRTGDGARPGHRHALRRGPAGLRAWPRPPSAPTPARRSWTGCCTGASPSSPAGSSPSRPR